LHYKEMIGQFYTLDALPMKKVPPTPTGKEAEGAPEPDWTLRIRERSLDPTRN
jgi:hypothetical protein